MAGHRTPEPTLEQERIALVQRIVERANGRDMKAAADSWARKAREFEREAETVRDTIRRIDTIARATTEKERAPT